MRLADLHCHTTASDGTLTPAELVRLASEIGLAAVGVTDHDSVDGIAAAQAEGRRLGVEVIPGLELNTDYEGSEIHILGYYMNLGSRQLQLGLANLRDARNLRVKLIVEKLAQIGLKVDLCRIMEIASDGAVGRPHVAQAMIEKGYVSSIKQAFDQYIGTGCPAYVSRYKLTPQQGIGLIRQANGVAVLAHPGLVRRDDLIKCFIDAGLNGIEVYHTSHTPAYEKRYAELAERLGLLLTGGSDFHGPGRKEGISLGDRTVSLETVRKLTKLHEEMEKWQEHSQNRPND